MTAYRRKPVAVIGAGIIGVMLARKLQKAGKRVLLFDPVEPGMETSFGNAGYIAMDEIFPLAHGNVLASLPRMLMDPLGPLSIRWQEMHRLWPWFLKFTLACRPRVAARGVAALADIQSGAEAAWKTVIAQEKLGDLIRQHGSLKVFESDRGFEENQGQRDAQRNFGIDCREMSGKEVRHMVPELAKSIRHGAYYANGMHTTNPYTLTKRLFEAFLKDGGKFLKERVLFLEHKATYIKRVRTNGALYAVGKVVVTTGYQSGRILTPLNYRVPIIAERGYHIEVTHKPLKFDMPIGVYERGFYITPMDSGLRLAGTTEFSSAAHNENPNWRRSIILKRHIKELMPGITGKETSRWMGHRPTMPDFLPVLGKSPKLDNLYLAFGHQHLGLTLAAITGDIMVDVLAGRKPSIDLAPFDIKRFQ